MVHQQNIINSIEISLPVPPNRANASSSARWNHSKKLKYQGLCERSFHFLYTHKKSFPFEAAKWTGRVEVFNYYDIDNLMALFKWPLDALVKYGVVKNDNPKHLKPIALPSQVIKREGDRFMHITLFRCEPFLTEKERLKNERKARLDQSGQSEKETQGKVEASKHQIVLR